MPYSVIHWFRRDLRLTDNTALHHASASGGQVVPVYFLSEWKHEHNWTGATRQQFLCGCLEALAKNIETLGAQLILRQGDAVKELERLIQDTNATAVYTNRDPDPFGKIIEARVAAMCASLGVEFHTFKDCTMHEPGEVLTGDGNPYRVFTPFAKNWLALPKPSPLPRIKSLGPAAAISSCALPTLETWGLAAADAAIDPPKAGERAARERMQHFVESGLLAGYGQQRNIPAGQTTSCLSQDLRFGLISIRELYHRCQQVAAPASVLTYTKELGWREFYMAILHFFPEVLETEFNPQFRDVPWDSNEEYFEAWKQGRTGFPIVDAGMRQLRATGLMHNRVRMITSMFLTKDLHCHWRLGESYFMQRLIDGEIASNNGGWQWSAGTGADAAPYFRIQNPWTQTKSYDPRAEYIKTWVPELKAVAPEKLLEPATQRLHPDFPLPIVDHATERDKTLARFKLGRKV